MILHVRIIFFFSKHKITIETFKIVYHTNVFYFINKKKKTILNGKLFYYNSYYKKQNKALKIKICNFNLKIGECTSNNMRTKYF